MNAKAKILVVDDDPDIRNQVVFVLKAEGYEVLAAGTKDEAEELLLGHKPDVAILDLMMETMDAGFVLAHRISELYPGTPVVILSAVTAQTGLSFGSPSAEAQGWMKASKVLDKPVRADQLKAEVRRLLSASAKTSPTSPPKH